MTLETEQTLKLLLLLNRHKGKGLAVKAGSIREVLNIEPRVTAQMVADLVSVGFPVCSSAFGYYTPETEAEWNEYLSRERSRAMSLLKKVSEANKNHLNELTLFEA